MDATAFRPGQCLHVRTEFRRLSATGRPMVRIGEQHVNVEMADVVAVEAPVVKVGDWVHVVDQLFMQPARRWKVHALDGQNAWIKATDDDSFAQDLFMPLEFLKVAA